MTINNTTIPNVLYPVANAAASSNPFVDEFKPRDPTPNDVSYLTQKKWLNTATGAFWELQNFVSSNGLVTANWIKIGSTIAAETLTGNTGGAVPSTGNNINVVGDGTYITTVGTPATSTLTIEPGGGLTTLYTENTGTAASSAGNLNVLGGTGIGTVGSGNTITINADASIATTYTANTGSAVPTLNNLNILGGTGITTSGSGNTITIVSTGVMGAINQITRQVFTTTGTYTPTTGMVYCDIEVVGGGGGGGGAATTSSNVTAGGGGGAGGYARGIFSAATIGASKAVTIGAAGTAGGTGLGSGGTGGTTSVGALISATGGGGGQNNNSPNVTGGGIGGVGGVGSLGNFQTTGQPGGFGYALFMAGGAANSLSGCGGNSFFGGAANAVGVIQGGNSVGNNANSYGGGGSGGASAGTQSGQNGGTGFAGIVVITEYIS